jgi:hypothetical protein
VAVLSADGLENVSVRRGHWKLGTRQVIWSRKIGSTESTSLAARDIALLDRLTEVRQSAGTRKWSTQIQSASSVQNTE